MLTQLCFILKNTAYNAYPRNSNVKNSLINQNLHLDLTFYKSFDIFLIFKKESRNQSSRIRVVTAGTDLRCCLLSL